MSYRTTEADHGRLAVRIMKPYFPQRCYSVVMRKGKFPNAEARAFVDPIRPSLLTHRDDDDPRHSGR